jgi:hypothetical protein
MAPWRTGRDSEPSAVRWIYGGTIPQCPCGAPSEDQVRRSSGVNRLEWFCLICGTFRAPPADWVDELVPISDADLKARNAAMAQRVRERWRRAERA